jgi:hypothetical protein
MSAKDSRSSATQLGRVSDVELIIGIQSRRQPMPQDAVAIITQQKHHPFN